MSINKLGLIVRNRFFFGDKIYMDKELTQNMIKDLNPEMLTPIKAVKGMSDIIKKRIKAADDLYSTAVSKVRQPIEALFSWLIQKTYIQKAGLVRSTKGLLVHTFGKLSAAFIDLAF